MQLRQSPLRADVGINAGTRSEFAAELFRRCMRLVRRTPHEIAKQSSRTVWARRNPKTPSILHPQMSSAPPFYDTVSQFRSVSRMSIRDISMRPVNIEAKRPCVVYLHGNCSSRLEAPLRAAASEDAGAYAAIVVCVCLCVFMLWRASVVARQSV